MSVLKERRQAVGMSQSELAARSGVAQSNIASYESGKRPLSDAMLHRLLDRIRPRPSDVVERYRAQIIEVVESNRGSNPRVFGSAARGADTHDSDLDLIVDADPDASIFDIATIAVELEELLGISVDVITTGGIRPEHHREILAEAIPL